MHLSANCFNLDQSKVLSSGNGLTPPFHLYIIRHMTQIHEVICSSFTDNLAHDKSMKSYVAASSFKDNPAHDTNP